MLGRARYRLAPHRSHRWSRSTSSRILGSRARAIRP
jgi:hypothetical protein